MMVVAITWRDSAHPAGRWEAVEDVKPYSCIIVSVGVVVYEDKDHTVVVPSWSTDKRGMMVNGAHTIPTQAIMHKTMLAEINDG